jgi:hypothetical protein
MAITDTYQVYDFTQIEKALGIKRDAPGLLEYSDERAARVGSLPDGEFTYKALQYGFCQPEFYLNHPDAPKNDDAEKTPKYATRITATEGKLMDGSKSPKMADAALGSSETEVTQDGETPDLSEYTAKYTFGDPLFKPYEC